MPTHARPSVSCISPRLGQPRFVSAEAATGSGSNIKYLSKYTEYWKRHSFEHQGSALQALQSQQAIPRVSAERFASDLCHVMTAEYQPVADCQSRAMAQHL